MSYYEILLVLHIAAAAIWLGSGCFLQMLVWRAGEEGRAAFHIARINTVSRIELVVLYLVLGAAVLLSALAYWTPKLRPATS